MRSPKRNRLRCSISRWSRASPSSSPSSPPARSPIRATPRRPSATSWRSTRFTADIDKTDLSDWVYNASPDTPGDLGYWVGYRIAKAYYRNAPDKRQALREIFGMSDPKAFLEKSGWYPGIELD